MMHFKSCRSQTNWLTQYMFSDCGLLQIYLEIKVCNSICLWLLQTSSICLILFTQCTFGLFYFFSHMHSIILGTVFSISVMPFNVMVAKNCNAVWIFTILTNLSVFSLAGCKVNAFSCRIFNSIFLKRISSGVSC